MARSPRTPNKRLADLLKQAQMQQGQLARAVNRLGQQRGLDLHYAQPNASQWIAGVEPKPEVRALIVEALSERLGRPVTHNEAGLMSARSILPSEGPDTLEELMDLGRADMDPTRRSLLATTLFSVALTVPMFTEAAASAADDAVSPGKATTRIGNSQVQSVRAMTERIADILDEFGAGHARPMAAAFLVNTVGPWLRAQASEKVHASMLAAASDLTYLTGWMAMYEKAHGLGQTYYLKALNLAQEAQDHVTYCRTLRGMSLQASNLGYGHKSLELADSAAEAAPSAGPRLVAFLRGQQAHASSMVGDRRQAHARLREAEDALSKADNRRDAIGGYDQTAYLFHVSHVLYEERDLPGSIKVMKQSIKVQPPQERQGRVHAYAVLAQRQQDYGHLDAACDSWARFLDEYELVSSARGDDHFATMRKRLAPHAKSRAVKNLAVRAQEVAALKT
ncbi:hypothetical protein ACFYW8_10900 [Streptomyces sp. NPDC002742]|uniref:hypothetical protein n=1 Tax=Streptomyces sp. NPDC002742 TaxID=3364663 RepID=UPI0036AF7C3D